MMTSLSFLGLLLEASDTSDRIQIGMTLLLTQAAYKIVTASELPAIPYLTRLDLYLNGEVHRLQLHVCKLGVHSSWKLVSTFCDN